MKLSPITRNQLLKIIKAGIYSFASGFTAAVSLMSLDFIRAAQDGTASIVNLSVALIFAGLVGGVNALAVTIKQLFTESK